VLIGKGEHRIQINGSQLLRNQNSYRVVATSVNAVVLGNRVENSGHSNLCCKQRVLFMLLHYAVLQVTLRGPESPLEMKLYNLTQVGMPRMVNIEWNSVNSVLLDTEPQDPHDR
jgi:hypothetical protein